MKFFLGILLVLLLFVVIGMLVVFYYVRKGIRYFRSFGNGQTNGEAFGGQTRHTRRQTTTGGVTIEDRRDPERAKKKIFAQDEGEYVDFTEN